MAWRLARSLDVLQGEVEAVAPGTTFWTIGDADHRKSWSDHNPNQCCDVVCAADILGSAGLDLAWFAGRIVVTDPPALKYVIHQDRIWFPGLGWQPYHGAWHSHVHVSVGWGPDGRSTGPYDDTSPWGVEEEHMPSAQEIAKAVVRELLRTTVRSRVTGNEVSLERTVWGGGYEAAYRAREGVAELLTGQAELAGQVAGLRKLVEQLAGADPVPLTPEQLAALTAAVEAAARAPGERIAAALAEAGQELADLAENEPA